MIVIYHNPSCSTSRNALAMIRDSGAEPVVIDYTKAGWTRGQLLGLFACAGVAPAEALRLKGNPEAEARLAGVDDEAILAAMVAEPKLVERPFVCTPKGARLCRPVERLREIL